MKSNKGRSQNSIYESMRLLNILKMVLEKNVENKMDRWNNEVFKKAKEEILLLQILKNRCHLWIGHIMRHNEFVVKIVEGAISGKKSVGRPQLQYLKQVTRNTGADSYTAMRRMANNKS
jgi:hypothetical protein